jgi:hypothetical protein
MRRVLPALLLAACTLDPPGVLDSAALKVQLADLTGDHVTVRVTDLTPKTVEKNAPVSGDTMEIVFEAHTLADGPVDVDGELFDVTGQLIGCATRRATAGGIDNTVLLGFSSPSNDAFNCGTCGLRCAAPHATASCVDSACQFACASGYVLQPDGGCALPTIHPPPDAGTPDAGETPDAGGDDAGTPVDAGMTCTQVSPENDPTSCSDGIDNNCDMRIDCADPGCQGISRTCTLTGGCMGPGVQQWDCATRTWGDCVGAQATENTVATCSDGKDNDCDGKIDCAEDSCNDIHVSCTAGVDICVAGVKLWSCTTHLLGLCLPYIPLPEAPLLCGDGVDNDCNGLTDCADSACTGFACGLGKTCCSDGSCAATCP